jgi:hypothetical protein
MIKKRLSPQNKIAMNLTVTETEIFKLTVLCMRAGEWDKATCQKNGLIPIHQN